MKKKYSKPSSQVIEIRVGRSLLDELSGTETQTGGVVDDARRDYSFEKDESDIPRHNNIWEEEE